MWVNDPVPFFRCVSTSRFHKFCVCVCLCVCLSVPRFDMEPHPLSLEAQDFKICTEILLSMSGTFLRIWHQSITNDVLLDSLEDALETLRREHSSDTARDLKLCKEIPQDMSSTLVFRTTPLTPVRNQWQPLRLLRGRSGDIKKMG